MQNLEEVNVFASLKKQKVRVNKDKDIIEILIPKISVEVLVVEDH